jgi:hypothetical protein
MGEPTTSAVVITGPIQGTVECEDGTVYDVSADAINVDPDHAAEVAALIGQRYQDEGHPVYMYSEIPFEYVPPEEVEG